MYPPPPSRPWKCGYRHTRAVGFDELLQRAQERYEDGEARLPDDDRDARQRQLTRLGNAANARGALPADARPTRRGARRGSTAPPRAGARAATTRRRTAGAARSARSRRGCSRRLGRRGGRRALGARARRGRGRVADRPLRGGARAARRSAGTRRRGRVADVAARADGFPQRRRRRARGRSPRATTVGYIEAVESVLALVRDARRVPRGRARRGHGARAPGARRAARPAAELESPLLPPA